MRTILPAAMAGLVISVSAWAEQPLGIVTPHVVVTATRFPESDLDRPVNMTVLTREDIERSGAHSVPELLAREPGFTVRDLFGNQAAAASVDLRGLGATAQRNTLVLVDGRRVSDIDLSGVQWSAIPVFAIERIEIVRGGGSVLYGEGAVAGVVNIITRAPAPAYGQAGATVGSFNTREGRVSAGTQASRAGAAVSARRLLAHGYRDNNENAMTDVHGDLRVQFGAAEIGLKAGADRQQLRLPGARQVQPSAGVNELETDRRGTSTPLDYSTRDGEYGTAFLSTTLADIDVLAELGHRNKRQASYFDFGGFPDYREADLSVWSFTPRSKIPLVMGGRSGQLVIGADFYRWDYRLSRADAPENIGQPINVVDARQDNLGGYALFTARPLPATTVSAGWRAERMTIAGTDRFDPTAPGGLFGSGAAAGEQQEHEHAYELGLRQELSRTVAAMAKAGRSYRFATVDEIYEFSPAFTQEFQFLRPQIAYSREVGAEQRLSGGSWRATVFQMDIVDEIHLDPFSAGVGNTNLPPSRRNGIEIEAAWRLLPRILLEGSYTYTKAQFREGAIDNNSRSIAGKSVPLVPRHRASATTTMDLAARTQLVLTALYVDDQFMENDEANDFGVRIPAYTVVDAALRHEAGGWRLGIAVNNLFAEKYYTYAVRSQFVPDRYNAYPLPERALFISAEYRFGD